MAAATTNFRPQILGAYRRLLLASRVAFGRGTERDRITAVHIRKVFEENAHVTDPKDIKKMLKAAKMAEQVFLKEVYTLTETDKEGVFQLHYREDQTIDLRPYKPAAGTKGSSS